MVRLSLIVGIAKFYKVGTLRSFTLTKVFVVLYIVGQVLKPKEPSNATPLFMIPIPVGDAIRRTVAPSVPLGRCGDLAMYADVSLALGVEMIVV